MRGRRNAFRQRSGSGAGNAGYRSRPSGIVRRPGSEPETGSAENAPPGAGHDVRISVRIRATRRWLRRRLQNDRPGSSAPPPTRRRGIVVNATLNQHRLAPIWRMQAAVTDQSEARHRHRRPDGPPTLCRRRRSLPGGRQRRRGRGKRVSGTGPPARAAHPPRAASRPSERVTPSARLERVVARPLATADVDVEPDRLAMPFP